jgi:signal transduction histidine kinase
VPQKNGEIRWIRGRGRAEKTPQGSIILRGAAVDITKLKLAKDAAHDLSQKLMNAQEKERARLARELHDDLSQSLALLSIQLHSAASKVRDPEALSSQLGNITTQIDRLSSDVHRISHELHPSKLEQLGLVAAVRGICREIGAAHGLKVDFRAENLPKKLPNDISLCLYRVAQESLQNVVKHSSASNALVELQLNRNELCLTVSDNGCGFDATASSNLDGIGLVSMKERLRAVDGTVQIESAVGAGTKVLVSVPFKEAQVSLPEIASSAIAH